MDINNSTPAQVEAYLQLLLKTREQYIQKVLLVEIVINETIIDYNIAIGTGQARQAELEAKKLIDKVKNKGTN